MDYSTIADELAADHGLGKTKSGGSGLDDLAKQLANDHGIDLKTSPITKNDRIYVSPRPAYIPGYSEEESKKIESKQFAPKGPTTRDENLPLRAGKAVANEFVEGVGQARKGLGDTLSGKPASGIGDVAIGGLRAIASPVAGVKQAVGDVTGSEDIANRAAFVVGSALPIDMGISKAKTLVPSNKAFKTLVETIGPENVGNVAREMRSNQRLTPADLSPATRQTIQKLFVTEGDKTKNYLAQSVEGRLQSAKSAVEGAFDTAMGHTVDPVEKLKTLSDNIKAVGAKEINPVLKATKPVDLTPVIEHIDNVLKPGVMHVISNPESMLPYDKVQRLLEGWRGQLTNDKTVLTNPDVLNKIQSSMRRQAESLMRSPDAEAKAMGYSLFQVRNKIIDAIGNAGPKSADDTTSAYKAALGKYRDENNIATAFEHGHDAIIKNSKNLEDHPSFFKNWVKAASNEEKEAAKEGARVAIDSQINSYKSAARRGTDIGQSEFNRERIEALFGKEEAGKLFKKLEHERMIAETNSDLIRGSQTAMRQTADSRIALPTAGDIGKNLIPPAILEGANILSGGPGGAATALYAGLRGVGAAKHAIATTMAKEHNASYAKLALPVEGPDREALIKSLEAVANRQKPTMLSRVNSVARLFGP